ncbi:hypothetical protein A2U01_0074772, partial [Trifolium medium]|nr:hypothetical protein [Trifolium medium]
SNPDRWRWVPGASGPVQSYGFRMEVTSRKATHEDGASS